MNKKLVSLFILSILLVLILPVIAQAQWFGPEWVCNIFKRIQALVWTAFTALVIIMFVFAGFKYLIAKGDPTKISEANKTIIWSVVGVAVGLMAYSIFNIVAWILGGATGGVCLFN